MKDYIYEAKKQDMVIYLDSFDRNLIKGYNINRENNYVAIEYLGGRREIKEIEDTTIDDLNESLNTTLGFYCNKINSKVKEKVGFRSSIVGMYGLNAALNFAIQRFALGSLWLTSSLFFYLSIHGKLKLKRELKLVSWINDNKEKVNEVIKEEVEKKIEKPEITATTNNIPRIEYPKELVPYPEEIYEDGINLNNIDELDNKTLRKLKRKVKKRMSQDKKN